MTTERTSEVDPHPADWLCKPVIASWKARAEKAEKVVANLSSLLDARDARVAELEDALKACIDETPTMWAREKEEC